MKEVLKILYTLNLVTYILKNKDGHYISLPLPKYIQVGKEYYDENEIKQDQIIDMYVKDYAKKNNCEIITSTESSFNIPKMFSYQVNYKDLYSYHFRDYRCSKWHVVEYLKYKKCLKKHKEDLIYTQENFQFVTSCSGEYTISNTIYDAVICNHCNITFCLTDINKGFLYAVKTDIGRLLGKY
jgi:hypothetical protein